MKKIMIGVLCSLLLVGAPPVAAAQELALGGQPVGIELQTAGVIVAGFAEISADGLGHSVSDETTGEPLPIRGGQLTDAQIVSVQPGSKGAPGELSGCADHAQVLGEVRKNTDKGIYGVAGRALGAGSAAVGIATPGPASILTTLEGRQVRAYSVEISRVYQEQGAQRLLLTVTDPMLRQIAGGIVQGMSGSPFVQDGKLVGAVTHVSVTT